MERVFGPDGLTIFINHSTNIFYFHLVAAVFRKHDFDVVAVRI